MKEANCHEEILLVGPVDHDDICYHYAHFVLQTPVIWAELFRLLRLPE